MVEGAKGRASLGGISVLFSFLLPWFLLVSLRDLFRFLLFIPSFSILSRYQYCQNEVYFSCYCGCDQFRVSSWFLSLLSCMCFCFFFFFTIISYFFAILSFLSVMMSFFLLDGRQKEMEFYNARGDILICGLSGCLWFLPSSWSQECTFFSLSLFVLSIERCDRNEMCDILSADWERDSLSVSVFLRCLYLVPLRALSSGIWCGFLPG